MHERFNRVLHFCFIFTNITASCQGEFKKHFIFALVHVHQGSTQALFYVINSPLTKVLHCFQTVVSSLYVQHSCLVKAH